MSKVNIDKETEALLISNGFRKSKNGSLYKTIKKVKKVVFKVRVANHFKHWNNHNEILINYVYSSNNDIKRLIKKLVKNNIIVVD